MSKSAPPQLTLTCRLCEHRAMFPVLDGIRPGMTKEDATNDVVNRTVRAEDHFFRDHWQREHPVEAEEVSRHIALVARLARVTTYGKIVLDRQFEESVE